MLKLLGSACILAGGFLVQGAVSVFEIGVYFSREGDVAAVGRYHSPLHAELIIGQLHSRESIGSLCAPYLRQAAAR